MKRVWRLAVGFVSVSLLLALPTAGVLADEPEPSVGISIVPQEGSRVVFRTGSYEGELSVVVGSGGLALIERQTVDGYLAGISEVPFSWPPATLEAQAIAARTFLAWTLRRGRSSAGDEYGFDICASTQCQVYRGAGVADGPDGDRWLEALEATEAQILVYEEAPAQALYSASHGSSSRGAEEIWGGSSVPYLGRVESPEEGVSPFDTWLVEIPMEVFAQVMRAAGVDVGFEIEEITVVAAPGSRSVMRVVSASGITTIPLTTVRAAFNLHGPRLYPGLFPGYRNDGRRLPQSIPSYSFTTSASPPTPRTEDHRFLPPGDLPETGIVRFNGMGWGHGVGMSQWGAFAMGEEGATAEEILAHYYGGLTPRDAGDLLPTEILVGLAWDEPWLEFDVIGTALVRDRVRPERFLTEGRWRVRRIAGTLVLVTVESPPGRPHGPLSL